MRHVEHVEQLETRRVLASFTASSVAELIANINAANAAGGSNTIALAAGGSFKLSAVDNMTNGATGLPVIAAGNTLTIVGNNATIERSSAKATPAFRILNVASGGSLSLNDLTLSRGLSSDDSFAGVAIGGGVRSLGTLSLNRVTVQNCIAQRNQNFGFALGGGIYSGGVLDVTDSSIENNQALGADATFDYQPIPGGRAEGGGLYVAGGTAVMSNTTFSSNLARGGDGANAPMPHKRSGGFPVSTVGGRGGNALGGALHIAGGNVTLRGCTVTRNTATGGTGGTSVGNLPRAANGTGQGGGIYVATPASVSLDAFTRGNTQGNTASTGDNDIFGAFTLLA